ncbi:hypothetical protein ACFUN7_18435 [Streptomyces sp. NPDC057236]|uniref:hypothetical protein n=1 Tax=Streptomyces sp. NPDC057236 TaxID=3346059 RepID=UPI003638744A
MTRHLSALADGLRVKVAPRLLDGNSASALAGAAHALPGADGWGSFAIRTERGERGPVAREFEAEGWAGRRTRDRPRRRSPGAGRAPGDTGPRTIA